MAAYISGLPSPADFFPPTPRVFGLLFTFFKFFPILSLLQWSPLSNLQAMGRTSAKSVFNLPGRYAWAAAEVIGPSNLIFVLFSLPSKLKPRPEHSSSFLGTGLPAQNEILGLLYVIHYVNRAVVSPLFMAPSMSPIHPCISLLMSVFQFTNSSNISCWLVYSTLTGSPEMYPVVSLASAIGIVFFVAGLSGNIKAENMLFEFRRGAARRKAKSEGKVVVSYEKVYVIPPAKGPFEHILFPHYVYEWIEWTGFYILGGAWGLGWGWNSPALWFVIVEICTMLPRAYSGKIWYEQKFGKRAVGGRAAAFPGII